MENRADISFNNVRFCYGEVCAVEGVNLSLLKKKMTVLVGPNGGGKSTLIRLITGLIKPEEGSIIFHEDIKSAYVPQRFSFETSFPLTVGDLVLQGTLPAAARPFAKYNAAQKKKAAESISRVGLNGYEHRSIGQLSGGQLKRAVIARALASDAKLIALDEPDASLDVDAAKELYGLLSLLKSEKTIVIASHNIRSVLDIADKAVYVNKTVREYTSPGTLKDLLEGGILL